MEPFGEITSKDYIYFETLEHNHTKKSTDWYWVVGIIALAVIVSSALFGNFTFAVIILLATIITFFIANKDPEVLKIAMDNKGIYVNKEYYSYEDLESFWVEDDYGLPKILVKSKKLFMHLIVIPIAEDIDPDLIKFFLGYYLDQEKLDESLFQIIFEYFGF